MPVTRIELCIDGLETDVREQLLDVFWTELRISPGMVSADGNTELALSQCGAAPEDAPLIRIGDQPHPRVTPERLALLLRLCSSR